jgi:hypothetical protein
MPKVEPNGRAYLSQLVAWVTVCRASDLLKNSFGTVGQESKLRPSPTEYVPDLHGSHRSEDELK